MDCIGRCNMRESWKDLWEFEADLKCPRDKIYYWPYAGGRCGYALLNGWDVELSIFVQCLNPQN